MFIVAFLLGIYSYFIFFLGIVGVLYKEVIIAVTLVGLIALFFGKREAIAKIRFKSPGILFLLLFSLIFVQILINFIGVLGPEIGFDALWYHLTLPKLYLENHTIFFIPGGLLYYSAMPKLAEMLYVGGLAFGNEVFVKIIHFSFGLLTCLALYKLERKFFSPLLSLAGVIIFYANLVVGWESSSVYIDLARSFFEVMGLWGFINWYESRKEKWLYISAAMIGFAITTKVLAIGSLFIFSLLLMYVYLSPKKIVSYWLIALIIPLPWFIFSFIHTGNPVYPFFTQLYSVSPTTLNISTFLKDLWNLFTQASDPLSPIYIILLPLFVIIFPKFKPALKMISFYALLSIIIWYFTPRTGGGRFILPYLPAFSLLCIAVCHTVLQQSKRYKRQLAGYIILLVVLVSLLSIGYRFMANKKYIPVILGYETKTEFLTKQLNFSFGDFYDTDNFFESHIKSTDKVLLYGFHNLYYVNFPFVDASWVKKGDTFTAVATQNMQIPERFNNWQRIYHNDKTIVNVYVPPKGVCKEKCSF